MNEPQFAADFTIIPELDNSLGTVDKRIVNHIHNAALDAVIERNLILIDAAIEELQEMSTEDEMLQVEYICGLYENISTAEELKK